jgi:O-methyltransferase involved in polyketide biosynthesis
MEATPDPSVNLLERGEGVTATAERAAARGEPWLSLFDPAELCELLRREGFKIVEDLGLPEIAERLYGDLRRDIRVGAGPHIVRANRNR